MAQINEEVKTLWQTIYNLGLVKEDEFSPDELEAIMEKDESKLKQLLFQCEDSEYVQKLTFDELLRLPFEGAKKAVDTFSMEKRIKMLNELTERKTYYYEQTSRYCGVTQDQLITASEFRSLLGKIKHIEIIQNWLYGIV